MPWLTLLCLGVTWGCRDEVITPGIQEAARCFCSIPAVIAIRVAMFSLIKTKQQHNERHCSAKRKTMWIEVFQCQGRLWWDATLILTALAVIPKVIWLFLNIYCCDWSTLCFTACLYVLAARMSFCSGLKCLFVPPRAQTGVPFSSAVQWDSSFSWISQQGEDQHVTNIWEKSNICSISDDGTSNRESLPMYGSCQLPCSEPVHLTAVTLTLFSLG